MVSVRTSYFISTSGDKLVPANRGVELALCGEPGVNQSAKEAVTDLNVLRVPINS